MSFQVNDLTNERTLLLKGYTYSGQQCGASVYVHPTSPTIRVKFSGHRDNCRISFIVPEVYRPAEAPYPRK